MAQAYKVDFTTRTITITAESAAIKVRYVSSEKS